MMRGKSFCIMYHPPIILVYYNQYGWSIYIVREYYCNIYEPTYPKQNHPSSIVLVRLNSKLHIVVVLLNLQALVSRAVLYETFVVVRLRVVSLLELKQNKTKQKLLKFFHDLQNDINIENEPGNERGILFIKQIPVNVLAIEKKTCLISQVQNKKENKFFLQKIFFNNNKENPMTVFQMSTTVSYKYINDSCV